MRVTREQAAPAALSNTTLGGNPIPPVTPTDPGDTPDPVDLALDAVATVPFVISGSPAVVQSAFDTNDGLPTLTVVLPSAPTPGNILVGWQTERATPLPEGPTGWTAHPDGMVRDQAGGGYSQMYYKVAQTGESSTIVFNANNNNNHVASVIELSGVAMVGDHDEAEETFSDTMTLSLTAATDAVIVVGASVQINDGEAATMTPVSSTTEAVDTPATGGAWPRHWLGYRIVAAGTFTVGATYPFNQWWAAQGLVFAGGDTIRLDAPLTVDGDDVTYTEDTSSLADGLHVDIGAPTRLTSVRLLLGSDTSGSKTYELWAANEDDFSDEVMVATETFTATGSLTADEVLYTITTSQAYRYYRFEGETEDRRWYTFEAFGITGFSLALDDLSDVDTTGKDDADVLTWDEATLTWIAAPPAGGGMTNPMTTAGDLIVGGTAGAPTRLAKGSDGDVLTVDPTTHLLVWAAPSPVADILDIPTAETDTSLVLAPDGAGGVEFRAESGGGGGGSQSYIGYNTVGASFENMTINRQYMKRVTLAAAGTLASIDVHVKATNTDPTFLIAHVLTDVSSLPVLVRAFSSSGPTLGLKGGNAARWLSLPLGVYLTAGTYWIGFTCGLVGSSVIAIAYDTGGSDRYFTVGPYALDGDYTSTTDSTLRYSIRGNLIS